MRAERIVEALLDNDPDPKEFLDRNGPEQLYPEIAHVLRRLKKMGFKVIDADDTSVQVVYAGKVPSYKDRKGVWFLNPKNFEHNSLMYRNPWVEWAAHIAVKIRHLIPGTYVQVIFRGKVINLFIDTWRIDATPYDFKFLVKMRKNERAPDAG